MRGRMGGVVPNCMVPCGVLDVCACVVMGLVVAEASGAWCLDAGV